MRYLLLLDYDGTLTPIVSQPDKAKLKAAHKKTLQQLIKDQRFMLAIVTGRTLKKIKTLLGLSNITYICNHGFEIKYKNKLFIQPQAKKSQAILKKIKALLAKELKPYQGFLLEDKKYTLSIHYRQVKPSQTKNFKKTVLKTVTPFLKQIRMTTGKKVFELRPPIKWDKGQAVLWLMARLKDKFTPVYIGDDTTDEDAFKALKNKGLTFHVGQGKTLAKQKLKNTTEVYSFLKNMLRSKA